MSLLGLYTHARDPVTTEWDDIQRRLGNLPPLEQPEAPEAADDAGAGPLVPSTSDASEREADEELAALRTRRLNELKQGRFGSLIEIKRDRFVSEVNQAGDGIGVVVFLFKKGHYPSSYMLVLLEKLASCFKDVKFVQIGHEECIPGYPDANLPTLLLYRDDELLGQLVGTSPYGGSSYGIDDVEWELAAAKLIETEIVRNPHEQPHR